MFNLNLPFSWLAILLVVVMAALYYLSRKGGRKVNTPFLNSYTVDFTRLTQTGHLDPVIGRQEEVQRLAQILARRTKNNAVLIGAPGVGKTAIVEGLAQRIVQGEVPEHLLGKKVLALDVANLLSGTKYRGEFEQRIKKILQEIIRARRLIILFIDEFHAVVQSHGAEGAINFADILKSALARGDLQMIGATTIDEYRKYIKTDSALERRLQPLEIKEPTEEETIKILYGVKDKYREYHKVEFTDAALETAAKLSHRLIKERKLPDKAIDAMDEAGAMVKVSHLHTDVPLILYQAAVQKHPEVAKIWRQIQEIDKKINQKSAVELVRQREALEKQLEKKGVETVDSADVEKVIREWSILK